MKPAEETVTDFPSQVDVEKLYRHRFSAEVRHAKEQVWRVVVTQFFQRWIKETDTVLDLGCGYGEFLNHVVCARRIGVDFNPDSLRSLDEAVEFHQGDVTDLSFLPDNSVQVVFTSNMLEHLRSKAHVERLIVEARRVLAPGGHFIAMGPNIRHLHGRYWDFWDHNVAISDDSLVEFLEYAEFNIIDRHGKFLPYTTQSALPRHPALVKLYLRTPIAWRILGKQFLIRAQKTSRS